MEENNKIEFNIKYIDEYGESNELKKIYDSNYLRSYNGDIEFLLDRFKEFLLSCGYNAANVSRVQYLEDNEWKDVLVSYGEWNEYYERIFNERKE